MKVKDSYHFFALYHVFFKFPFLKANSCKVCQSTYLPILSFFPGTSQQTLRTMQCSCRRFNMWQFHLVTTLLLSSNSTWQYKNSNDCFGYIEKYIEVVSISVYLMFNRPINRSLSNSLLFLLLQLLLLFCFSFLFFSLLFLYLFFLFIVSIVIKWNLSSYFPQLETAFQALASIWAVPNPWKWKTQINFLHSMMYLFPDILFWIYSH